MPSVAGVSASIALLATSNTLEQRSVHIYLQRPLKHPEGHGILRPVSFLLVHCYLRVTLENSHTAQYCFFARTIERKMYGQGAEQE